MDKLKSIKTWIRINWWWNICVCSWRYYNTCNNDCRTTELCKFKKNLGFKLYDVNNCKEQTVLESIKDKFEGKKKCKLSTVS